MTKPNELTVTDAALAIGAGSMTATDLHDACIARAEAREDAVGAWIHLDPERTRASARALDERSAPYGPLHGIPVGLKDIIDTADMPTENGSAYCAGRRPVTDSTIARLLREAGAVILGKAVSTEFALSGAGKTRNPHNPDHTPGGSSSGSAAAVADFQVPVAIGTQTGGSMLRPGSYCGIHAFKPTFGSISRSGMWCLSRVLDHPGIYARSLRDIAIVGDVLMKKDARDLDMRGHIATGLVEAVAKGPVDTPPRIAFVKGPMWAAAEPYMDDLFAGVLKTLGETAREVEMTGVFDTALDCHTTVINSSLAANLGDIVRKAPDKLKPETIRRVEAGFGISAEDYIKAIEFRDTLAAAIDRMFANADVIITACAPGEAPRGLKSTGDAIFQKIWTLTGVPTVNLPLLTGPSGLPVGVQVVGRFGHDAELLRNALWIERAFTSAST